MNQQHQLDYATVERRFPPLGIVSAVIGILTCIADLWVAHGLSAVDVRVALLLPTAAITGIVTGRMAKSMSTHEFAGFGWIVSLLALIGSFPAMGLAVLFQILPRC